MSCSRRTAAAQGNAASIAVVAKGAIPSLRGGTKRTKDPVLLAIPGAGASLDRKGLPDAAAVTVTPHSHGKKGADPSAASAALSPAQNRLRRFPGEKKRKWKLL